MNSGLSKSNLNVRDINLSSPKPPTNGLPKRSGSIKQLFKFNKINQENRIYFQNPNCKYSQLGKLSKVNHDLKLKKNLNSFKSMSYSTSDLRELQQPKSSDNLEDDLQDEIQERRHEMYIAEIEMESILRLGPTLR